VKDGDLPVAKIGHVLGGDGRSLGIIVTDGRQPVAFLEIGDCNRWYLCSVDKIVEVLIMRNACNDQGFGTDFHHQSGTSDFLTAVFANLGDNQRKFVDCEPAFQPIDQTGVDRIVECRQKGCDRARAS